jgi:hypothetical protein
MKSLVISLCCILSLPSFLHSASAVRKRSEEGAHPYCGTYAGRHQDELLKAKDRRLLIEAQKRQLGLTSIVGASRDVGQIAVIEDDGSIVLPNNPFDLFNTVLRLTPTGSGAYTMSRQSGSLNTNFGTSIAFADDAYQQITFQSGFQFPFFGATYSSVFVNSDGNLTFTEGDNASSERGITRFKSGPPRIGGFFADLNPETSPGSIYYNQLSDRLLITWNRIREYGSLREGSFQVALFPDGSFELTYGNVNVSQGIVGWTGGRDAQAINVVDLSAVSGTLSGPQAERFARLNQSEVDITALAKKFYETHSDDYEQLVVFTNFAYNLEGAFAFELNIKNEVQGINLDTFDNSAEYGSQGRLESYLSMNQLAEYSDNPDTIFLRTYSALEILAHETGHRFLAYVRNRSGNTNRTDLLTSDGAHWSFFFNGNSSVMEGNQIRDNGDGSFTTVAGADRYSALDRYLMGLLPSSEVGPLFYVSNVSGTSKTKDSGTEIGVTFRGTRVDLTVNEIIAVNGVRIPDASAVPRTFRQAYVLLVQAGTSPSQAELQKVDQLRQRFVDFFVQATGGLATVVTTLNSSTVVPVISGVTPKWGSTLGDTQVYISGSNFQPGATVLFGGAVADKVQVLSSSLISARTPAANDGAVSVVVTNSDGQTASLPNAFSYRRLNPVTISSNALRIPYVIDNLAFRSNLGINNPNSSSTSVRISLLDSRGLLVNRLESVVIPANGYIQKNSLLQEMEGILSPTGREGSLVLESDQTVQAFVSQIDNTSGDPSILESVRQGASRLILQSAANSGPFRSNLLVLNLSSGEARIDITALDRNSGQPIGTTLRNVAIEGNGFVRFENILEALAVSGDFGPVEIRSTNAAMLAAVAQVSGLNHNTSGFFQAQSLDVAEHALIVPYVLDNAALRTNLGLNNVGSGMARVSIELIGQDGSRLAASPTIQIESLGMLQINQIVSYLSGSSSTSQQGYLRIRADQPILAFASLIDNASDDPSIEKGLAIGSSALLLKSATNTNFRSTLVIVNPNEAAVAATLVAREGSAINNGNITGTRTVQIPAHGQFVSENILQELPASNSFGPIEIRSSSSDLPIIAVSRVYSLANNTSGFLEAQTIP